MKAKGIRLWAFLLLVIVLAGTNTALGESKCAGSLRQILDRGIGQSFNNFFVKYNLFATGRDLATYTQGLGPSFKESLAHLSSGNHWLDIGAGQAKAQFEFLSLNAENASVKTTAIGVTKPIKYNSLKKRILKTYPDSLANHRYLEGRLFEAIPKEEIGEVDLITDLFGAFSYSPHIDRTLQREIELLRQEGKLYVYSPFAMQIHIIDQFGKPVPLEDWVNAIKGVRVINHRSNTNIADSLSVIDGIQLFRTSEPIWVPPLELVKMDSGVVAKRTYRWTRPEPPP